MSNNQIVMEIYKKLKNRIDTDQVKKVIIMGSGWGKILAAQFNKLTTIKYNDIGLKSTRVQGHSNSIYYSKKNQTLFFGGRFHLYTGIDLETCVLPITIASKFKPSLVILTNASGALNPRIDPGEIVIIKDQINFYRKWRKDKIELTKLYKKEQMNILEKLFTANNISYHTGIYGGLSGPAYETPAEGGYYYKMGADLLGMSTVVEAEYAQSLGLPIAALSLATNRIPINQEKIIPVNHTEVLETARVKLPKILSLLIRP